jgi:hypothetical protein
MIHFPGYPGRKNVKPQYLFNKQTNKKEFQGPSGPMLAYMATANAVGFPK